MSFIVSLGEWLRKITKAFTTASIDGKVITLVRHNGTIVTLTTQDTTYSDATQSTSGLMSASDKALLDAIPITYVKSTGDLSTNSLTRTSASGKVAYALQPGTGGATSDQEVCDFGWNATLKHGAYLGLRSSSHITSPGIFDLSACDGIRHVKLIGSPDGNLTWNGNNVLTTANGLSLSGGVLSGNVTKPTPTIGDNSQEIATTEFVNNYTKDLVEGTLTRVLDPTQVSYSYVFKMNHIGFLKFEQNVPSATAGWTSYHVLTSSIKPKKLVIAIAYHQGSPSGACTLQFDTDGKLYLRTHGGPAPSNTYFRGCVVFPVDE